MTTHIRRLAFATLASLLCLAGAAGLCAAEPEVLFEDNFSELESSFPPPNEFAKASVENNMLVVTVAPERYGPNFYQSMLFGDIDLTLRVQFAAAETQGGTTFGIAFWGFDTGRYHRFVISNNGFVGVVADGPHSYLPVPWRRSSALKSGADVWNELRVVTVGKRATVYLNGEKIASFKGEPPESGSLIGPIVVTSREPATGRFANLRVVAPSGSDAVASAEPSKPSDPNVIYSDDFTELDPAWGPESEFLSLKDGALSIRPGPNSSQWSVYQRAPVDEIDASVKVVTTDSDPASATCAGIIFWSTSNDDFYTFEVSDLGQVQFAHWTKGRWLLPLGLRDAPAPAKYLPDSVNELRVVTTRKKATGYLNGVSVGTITSPVPIRNGQQFGLFAEAHQTAGVAEFRSLMVRQPQTPEK